MREGERGERGGKLFFFFRRSAGPAPTPPPTSAPRSIVASLRALREAATPSVDPTDPAAAAPPPSPDAAAAQSKLRVFCDALARAAAALDSRRHEALLTEVLAVGAWGVDEVRSKREKTVALPRRALRCGFFSVPDDRKKFYSVHNKLGKKQPSFGDDTNTLLIFRG